MLKLILLFTSILSLSLPTYRPMSSRTIDFGDNICYYQEYDSGSNAGSLIKYVKPCPEGEYCESTEGTNNYQLHTCETLPKYRNTLNADCSTDFECDTDLKCSGGKCVINEIYLVSDSITGTVYYCEDTNKLPLREITSSTTLMSCISPPGSTQKSTFENKYYITLEDGTNYYIGLEPYKVPGIIHLKQNSGTKDYDIDYIESSYIGKVEVGHFVQDERACESGIALYFYGNGELTKPSDITTSTGKMYKRCVNLKEVLSDDMIVYSLSDGKEKIYNKNELSSSYKNNLDFSYEYLTSLEMFKNYKEKLHSILEQCIKDYDYTEPYTCKNNELRKWWYFYYHPDDYMLYKDQKQVIDYLVQDKYYDYYQDESNGLRALKYMFYLLILLSL